jgi:hypothetical protein
MVQLPGYTVSRGIRLILADSNSEQGLTNAGKGKSLRKSFRGPESSACLDSPKGKLTRESPAATGLFKSWIRRRHSCLLHLHLTPPHRPPTAFRADDFGFESGSVAL